MNQPRRCALLGFGHIAETTHLPALASCSLAPCAVLEPQPMRQAAARACLPEARIFDSLPALLSQVQPELIDICTPPHLHFAQTRCCLEAGAHVLCEKPLVTDMAQLEDLTVQARRAGKVLGCVHNWTAAPIIAAAGDVIAQGSLGALQHIDAQVMRTQPAAAAGAAQSWRGDPQKAGGGIVFDHGWHGMSVLLRWAAAAPTNVAAHTSTVRHHGLGVEDTCDATIHFENGIEARYRATWAAESRRNSFTLRFAHGTLHIADDTLAIDDGVGPAKLTHFADNLAAGGYRPAWTAALLRQWLAEIDGKAVRGTLLDEAMWCLRLLRAIYTSAEARQTVSLHPSAA